MVAWRWADFTSQHQNGDAKVKGKENIEQHWRQGYNQDHQDAQAQLPVPIRCAGQKPYSCPRRQWVSYSCGFSLTGLIKLTLDFIVHQTHPKIILGVCPLNIPLPCTQGRGVGGEGRNLWRFRPLTPTPLPRGTGGEGLVGQTLRASLTCSPLWIEFNSAQAIYIKQESRQPPRTGLPGPLVQL